MSNVIPAGTSGIDRSVGTGLGSSYVPRQTGRALARLEGRTLLRLASVQAEGLVQTEKVHEIDRLTREAVSGQALLRHWADHLAGSDPLLADDLRFFTEIAKLGKGEIVADTVTEFCREGR